MVMFNCFRAQGEEDEERRSDGRIGDRKRRTKLSTRVIRWLFCRSVEEEEEEEEHGCEHPTNEDNEVLPTETDPVLCQESSDSEDTSESSESSYQPEMTSAEETNMAMAPSPIIETPLQRIREYVPGPVEEDDLRIKVWRFAIYDIKSPNQAVIAFNDELRLFVAGFGKRLKSEVVIFWQVTVSKHMEIRHPMESRGDEIWDAIRCYPTARSLLSLKAKPHKKKIYLCRSAEEAELEPVEVIVTLLKVCVFY